MGLHRKRARLAGEIEVAERRLAKQREVLAQVDAVIRLYEPQRNPELIPAIRPCGRCLFFRHGEQMRLCRDALREAGQPIKARAVAEYAMAAKGLPADDWRVRDVIIEQVRIALRRLERKGAVRRIIRTPDTWWELVESA